MRTKNLNGHSGCRVLLCEDENQVFVRKISSGYNYNERLKVQAEKQMHFKSEFVQTPQILECGMTDDGFYYFDMEYICGITLAEYMRRIEVGKIRSVVTDILQHILAVRDKKRYADEEVFLDKIHSLRLSLSGLDNSVVNRALNVLEAHSWKNFEKSICHGDLTLENIIVRDDHLYFIDFLDSFYDCWLLDVSTLLQDAFAMWAYRDCIKIDINTQIRLAVFRDILINDIQNMDSGMWMKEVFYALLLKLLRIYPYTKDPKIVKFLNGKTISVLSFLEEGVI